ncbi:hypothetical protein [Nostoc sp.]|uniref:hypothetical protein n=1 Tax=Nostoc sp. TaxID=1180 RepID=UPI002FFC410E
MSQIKDIAIEKTTADNGDYLVMQNPTTGETYKIKVSNFLAGLSGLPVTPVLHQLTFAFSGDANGLFYYLGTNKGATVWNNPANRLLAVTASSIGSGDPNTLSNRQADQFYTGDLANSWVMFEFVGQLKCQYYSIKSRSNDSNFYPRTWKLQGSIDGSTWVDLDSQNNNATLVSAGQWLSLPISATVSYSKMRILQNGLDSSGYNYFCLDEVELYGEYTP